MPCVTGTNPFGGHRRLCYERQVMRGILLALLALLAVGCDDLDEFRVRGEQVFAGPVVGSDSQKPDAGESERCEFVLCGFPERTTLTLRDFDPELAGGRDAKGTISTTDGTFVNTRLLPVAGLEHDVLSEYTFPGGGRVKSFILGARFAEGGARYAIVFISLMEDGRIELRIHAPSTAPNPPPAADDALFGVFRLCRGGCNP